MARTETARFALGPSRSLAAGVAFFGEGCGVAGFADELVIGVLGDRLLGGGVDVAGLGQEEGRVAAGVLVFSEGDGDALEAVAVAAFADDLELIGARRVMACDPFVDVAEERLVGGDPLFA